MEGLEEKNSVVKEYESIKNEINVLLRDYLKNFEKFSHELNKEKVKEIQKKLNQKKSLEKMHKYLIFSNRGKC